jgi:hypothetical protein
MIDGNMNLATTTTTTTIATAVLLVCISGCSAIVSLFIPFLPLQSLSFNSLSESEQQSWARIFVVCLSVGSLFASLAIGLSMKHVGINTCIAIVLVLGELHSAIWLFLRESKVGRMLGFIVFILFRQSITPVYVASLSQKLGFKYYGLLSAIGHVLSGVSLMALARGIGCIQELDDTLEGYRNANWDNWHLVQCLVMAGLLVVPMLDYMLNSNRQRRARQWWIQGDSSVKSATSFLSASYGALPAILEREDSDDEDEEDDALIGRQV